MIINEALSKSWSRVGTRATFGLVMLDLAEKVDRLMVVSADVSTSAGLDRFKNAYPEKYLDVGIAEQNMMGIAAGLASEGYSVFTTSFAPFQTMRCCEQIRVNLGYMGSKVCMVGLASGLVSGILGNTHCCFEDIGVLRSIPGITIITPADCAEVAKAVCAAQRHPGPLYVRLTGSTRTPIVYADDYGFEIGKAISLREGADVAIIASGMMVHESIVASDLLDKSGISAAVVDMHTVKPLDIETLRGLLSKKLIVTVEEHSVMGGLGSAVAEFLSRLADRPPLKIIGVPDEFVEVAEYRELLERYGLTGEAIADAVSDAMRGLY
ncbi:MAG: transketolase family protein [Synergistaceae bacterium]|jgi:transketolase|nr:transketolase family protein [Synergistaceae bacterium]